MSYKIDIQDLIPINKKGSQNDVSAFLNCDTEMEAFDHFKKLSYNLLKINDWSVNARKNPAEFFIYNKDKSQSARENDLVKIKIPAPTNKQGNGFDWVIVRKIQLIEDTHYNAIMLQMKPHSCPENLNGRTAHFYKDDATTTFILSKNENIIQLSIHGRNEIPNTKNVGFIDACRNFFVANGGIFGGSKLQWKDFADDFIKQ